MSKSSAPDANDHWKRLAAELGLEMDPEPAPPPPPEPEPPSQSAPLLERVELAPEVVTGESLGVWTTDSHEFVMAQPMLHEREPDDTVVESERDDAAEEEFPTPPEEPAIEEKPQRRRRRSRRRKGDEAPAGASSSSERPEDDDDSPAEVVKDWNIPSWNDLIASLYRPER